MDWDKTDERQEVLGELDGMLNILRSMMDKAESLRDTDDRGLSSVLLHVKDGLMASYKLISKHIE